MRRISAAFAVVALVGVVGIARGDEPALVPSGFEVFDAHGPIFVAPDGALVRRVPEAPASWRARVMTPGGAAPAPGRYTAVELTREPPLTLWVQTVDLTPVIVVETWLAPDPKAALGPAPAADSPGVRLRPGVALQVLRRVDAVAEVSVVGASFGASGWVPTAAIGRTYVAPPYPLDANRKTLPHSASIPESGTLLAAPGGAPIADLRAAPLGTPAARAVRLGSEKDGHVLVARFDRWSKIVGWIPAPSLGVQDPPASVTVFGNDVSPRFVRVDVAPGTPVFDRPGGVELGRYVFAHEYFSFEQRDGHAMIQLQGTIGAVNVWVPWTPSAPAPRGAAADPRGSRN